MYSKNKMNCGTRPQPYKKMRSRRIPHAIDLENNSSELLEGFFCLILSMLGKHAEENQTDRGLNIAGGDRFAFVEPCHGMHRLPCKCARKDPA